MVALRLRYGSGRRLGAKPAVARRAGAAGEQLFEMLAALVEVSSHLPEAPERGADPQTDLGLAASAAQLSAARMLSSSLSSRSSQLSCSGPSKAGSASSASTKVEAGVAAAHGLAVAALGQPLERVLAHRLEHPEARLAAGHALGAKQVVVQERLDAVDDVELEIAGDGLGTVER